MTNQTCPICNDRGSIDEFVDYSKTCWQCSGRGWFKRLLHENEKQICKRCGGKGFYRFEMIESRTCPQCHGQGRFATRVEKFGDFG